MDKITQLKLKFHKRNFSQIVERIKISTPYIPAFLIFCCLSIYLMVTYYNCSGGHNKFKEKNIKIETEVSNYFTSQVSQQSREKVSKAQDSEHAKVDAQARLDLDNLLNETIVGILNSLKPRGGGGPTPAPISRDAAISKERKELLRNNYSTSRGRPLRNFIMTTWRSGSTFLGEAVTSHPSTFYHYEPLLNFEIVQVRSGELATEAMRIIQSLLECDYSNLDDYINYGRSHEYVHSHNHHVWKYCEKNPSLCSDPTFLSEMCALFPIQVIKTVRLRVKLLKPLLQLVQNHYEMRILLLVRDPRATLLSRKHQIWCSDNRDCSQPSALCNDLVDDYQAISDLRESYPNQILALRYEDVSLNPISGVRKVVDFFGLDYTPGIESFVKTHTIQTIGGVTSTFRDSRQIPFKWIQYFILHKPDTTELDEIQGVESCKRAMELWGYNQLAINERDVLESFKALRQPPPWSEMIVPSD